MKRKIEFDSNTLILLSKNLIDKQRFADAFSKDKWIVSIVTKIEVLSKPGLAAEEKRFLSDFLSKCKVIGLSRRIVEETIRLRSHINRKLPDSIIAATAGLSKATLISNDSHLLKASYPGLVVEAFE
jgi:predicted nucleic acid-binding protein